jgi:hypothetical protein
MTSPPQGRGPRRRWPHALAATLAAALLCGALAEAQAALKDCDPVPGGFTVFMSEPEFTQAAFKSRDEMRDFMKRLTKQLDDGLDRRWARSPNPNPEIRFVNCVGRAPAANGQDFVETVVDTMYGRRVLLEVWGLLDMQASGGAAPRPAAEIRFLLVPMKFAADRNEPASPPLQRLDYVAPAGGPAPDFVSLIAKPQDIDAFVAAALGFKLLRERSHDLAHRNLCFASAQLQRLEKRLPAGRERDGITGLQGFVLASARRAIEGARLPPPAGAAGGRPSLLALQDTKDPCSLEIAP